MSTPMFDQYNLLKSQHRDAILLFRLGDFYEMFGTDAREGSRILGLTLTQRQGKPMCGVPHHAARAYVRKLLEHGKKVAICEQTGTPDGKTLTKREVVEVLSPGSVFDTDFLKPEQHNYLVAVGSVTTSSGVETIAVAACDASIGELILAAHTVDTDRDAVIRRELERLDPGELLVQESLLEESRVLSALTGDSSPVVINRIPDWGFDISESFRVLTSQLDVQNLHGFGFEANDPALLPAAAILEYLNDNAHHSLLHIQEVRKHIPEEIVVLDDATTRNLEIVRSLNDGGGSFTLLGILDFARTPMGTRRLRQWLLQPSRRMDVIAERHERVETLYRRQQDLQALRERLGDAYDLERLVGRLGVEKAHPKDLLAIAASLTVVIDVEQWTPWISIDEGALSHVRNEISTAFQPDAPIVLHEGGIFRSGFDEELDRYRALRDGSREILEEYLQEQRVETGISSLKIKYNRVLGHFFEVPKSQAHNVPESYIRRQSVTNAERFTTPRLSELEEEIQNAASAAVEREQALFLSFRKRLMNKIPLLRGAADVLAGVDTIASLAQAATVHGYRRPRLVPEAVLKITGGRHPVVEAHLPPGDFVANDVSIGEDTPRFALITGPNMAGKSTVLRQTALIALLAHAGSFVPADEATIGLCDRIFCRVGASDNIARGESTFLVEMNETSNILRNAGPHSLIIMDEVGRGTSTHDGLAIAWAVCEHILDHSVSRTLFATHYHELARISHPQFVSLGMAVEHSGEKIHFLKKLVAGAVDRSYGVDVARLAGLPDGVIYRARQLLRHFEAYGTAPADSPPREETTRPDADTPELRTVQQDELFSPAELIAGEIEGLQPDTLSPREALDLIYRWKERIRRE